MVRPYTWDQLRRATLRRQFPRVRGRGPDAVAQVVRRVGPIQAQVARAPFVAVAARLPGVRYDAVSRAYESSAIVRGSNLRGTVHACVREQHAVLDSVTREATARMWATNLRLTRVSVDDVRRELARFASGRWRTADDLRAHLGRWLGEHEGDEALAAIADGPGRATAHLHSGLVRRPSRGGWEQQTKPEYRCVAEVIGGPGPDREAAPEVDPESALDQLVRIHLAAFGPATRHDIAWWSGSGLRRTDAALERLDGAVSARPGPDDHTYYDLAPVPRGGHAEPGVRLLPEYDALLLGYAPAGRIRFATPEALRHLLSGANGLIPGTVLVDGMLRATWRLVRSGADRVLEVSALPGEQPLHRSILEDPVGALEAALSVSVHDIRVW